MRQEQERAAIVGAGGAGLLHALALRAAGVQVDAVYDPCRDQAGALAGMLGARRLRDPQELAGSTHSIVSITSPPRFHVAQAQLLARADRWLLVEKPLATSERELAQMSRLPGVLPVLQWRAGRGLVALREGVRAGVFGDMPHVSFRLCWPRDAAYFDGGRRGLVSWGASMLLSVGIHAVDAGLFLLGITDRASVASLEGHETWTERELDVATRAQLRAVFSTGATMVMHLDADPATAGDTERTTLVVEGGGARATLLGSESDPTSACPHVEGDEKDLVARACAQLPHVAAPPLLVPYLLDALRTRLLPPWGPVALAHDLVFRVMRNSRRGT